MPEKMPLMERRLRHIIFTPVCINIISRFIKFWSFNVFHLSFFVFTGNTKTPFVNTSSSFPKINFQSQKRILWIFSMVYHLGICLMHPPRLYTPWWRDHWIWHTNVAICILSSDVNWQNHWICLLNFIHN